MINTKLTENSESLFKAELDQAWNHYRHLEETRTKYLNFFFTIFLASVGFILTFAKGFEGKASADLYFGLSVFVFSLFLISSILLAGIVRIGYVLSSYEKVMNETRQYFHGDSSPVLEIWNIRKSIPSSVNQGLFSIQKSSRALVLGVCLILSILQVCLALQMYSLTATIKSAYVLGANAFIAIMISTLLYLITSIKRAGKEIERNKSNLPDASKADSDLPPL